MSRVLFQAKSTPVTATDMGNGSWQLETSIVDLAAIFTSADVLVGDVFIFDTGAWEPGTYTRYTITSILECPSPTSIKCIVLYDPSNDNLDAALDLNATVGVDGVICRPTRGQKLLPVIAPGLQMLSDAFSANIINYNLSKIIDNAVTTNGTLSIGIDGNATYLEIPFISKNTGLEKTRKLKVYCLVEGVKANQEVSCIFEKTVHISKSGQIVLEQDDFTSKTPGHEDVMFEAMSNLNKTTTFKLNSISGCVGKVDFSIEEFFGI